MPLVECSASGMGVPATLIAAFGSQVDHPGTAAAL